MTFIISFFALMVSFLVYLVSSEKLRLDLYNKRFDIYCKIARYAVIFIHNRYSQELKNTAEYLTIHDEFIIAYRESQFLFKKEAYNLIKETLELTSNFRLTYDDPQLFEHPKDKRTQIINSMEAKLKELEETINPYLDFRMLAAIPLLDSLTHKIMGTWHSGRLGKWFTKKV